MTRGPRQRWDAAEAARLRARTPEQRAEDERREAEAVAEYLRTRGATAVPEGPRDDEPLIWTKPRRGAPHDP